MLKGLDGLVRRYPVPLSRVAGLDAVSLVFRSLREFVRRYPVALCYMAALGAVSLIFQQMLSPASQQRFDIWASTNLTNLPHRPLSTMVVSGLIAESGLLPWLVLTGAGLILLVGRFGNGRAATIVIGAHVVGTLISEGIVAIRINQGILPESDRDISDVGPSYITAAALVAVILYAPHLWQRGIALCAWLIAVTTWFDGLTSLDVAAVGHVVSMITGALLGGLFVLVERTRRTHEVPRPRTEEALKLSTKRTTAGTPQSLPAASQP